MKRVTLATVSGSRAVAVVLRMGNRKLLLCLVLLVPIKISWNKKSMNFSHFSKTSGKAHSENSVGKVVPRRNIDIHKAWTRTWHVYLQLFQTFVMIVVERILYHIFPFRLCPIQKQNHESTTISSSLPPVKNTITTTSPTITTTATAQKGTTSVRNCTVLSNDYWHPDCRFPQEILLCDEAGRYCPLSI